MGSAGNTVSVMDMLSVDQVNGAGLRDWRKMGQGWHARFLTDGFAGGARFVAAIAAAGDELGHHPRETDEHEPPRQRFHLDVWVAPESVEARVAAGGVVVDDSHAPWFTVIADADGNRACVCTS